MSKFSDKALEVLGITLQYFKERFTEVSSLKGVLWLAGGGGWRALDPGSRGETVVQLMMILVGLILIFVPDKKSLVVLTTGPSPSPQPASVLDPAAVHGPVDEVSVPAQVVEQSSPVLPPTSPAPPLKTPPPKKRRW